MMMHLVLGLMVALLMVMSAGATLAGEIATHKTSEGDLRIEPINHSAVRFEFAGKQYYVDPAGQADWENMPKADVILITHEHGDHLSPETIAKIRTPQTLVVMSVPAAAKAGYGETMKPGEKRDALAISVETVPAYNITADRLRYHPRERGDVGFVLTFGDQRVYVAGDTEVTDEMKALRNIDIAFLPINLPYTMTPEEAAEGARVFHPRILYPYHQGKSDPEVVKRQLADVPGIEVRVLPLP